MPAAVDGERETPFAFARLGETGDDAQQGCLPTTGRPENTQEFARAEIEIDCPSAASPERKRLPIPRNLTIEFVSRGCDSGRGDVDAVRAAFRLSCPRIAACTPCG